MDEATALIDAIAWPVLAIMAAFAFRGSLRQIAGAVASRVERGDPFQMGPFTLGRSVWASDPPVPPSDGVVTDDHLSLVHRSWRRPEKDAQFDGTAMWGIHVALFGDDEVLDRVDYVVYRLADAWPEHLQVQVSHDRPTHFELKELANGFSLIRADVHVRGQEEVVHLSRFIDLVDESPPLRGDLLPKKSAQVEERS